MLILANFSLVCTMYCTSIQFSKITLMITHHYLRFDLHTITVPLNNSILSDVQEIYNQSSGGMGTRNLKRVSDIRMLWKNRFWGKLNKACLSSFDLPKRYLLLH